jgi:hypothetical protein
LPRGTEARPECWTEATATFQLTTLAKHDGVQLNAFVRKNQVVIPEAIEFVATPLFEGASVVGAQVSGEVVHPDGTRDPINLYDDGLPEHADAVPNDGEYSAR